MRITNIRKNGDKIGSETFYKIKTMLELKFKQAGFNTHVKMESLPAIKIGLGMKSFTIDPIKRGHNADTSQWAKQTKKGYKRTCTPTWEERELFNHIINDVFDKLKLTANIRNSAVTIRTVRGGRINSWDMERFGRLERCYYEITKESELEKVA